MGIDGYATHLPVLCHVLRAIEPFNVLEVGCGWYSTPLLRIYTEGRGGEHYILETNEIFAQEVASHYECMVQVFDGHSLPTEACCHWGLAFIDSAPESGRGRLALELKEWASVIVLHDSNPDWEPAYGYSGIIPQWKHHKQFTQLYPHTLVLTDSDEVWQDLGA